MVYFLIDSRSAATSIHPRGVDEAFGVQLGIIRPRADWPEPQRSIGIGGTAEYFPVPATYAFVHDDGRWEEIEGQVHLAQPTASNHNLPSILGWDILERFRVTMDWHSGTVTLGH